MRFCEACRGHHNVGDEVSCARLELANRLWLRRAIYGYSNCADNFVVFPHDRSKRIIMPEAV